MASRAAPCRFIKRSKDEKKNRILVDAAFLVACNNSNNAVNTIANVHDTLQEAVTDAEVAVVKQSFPQLFAYLKKQDPHVFRR
jgi:hypothetical protein